MVNVLVAGAVVVAVSVFVVVDVIVNVVVAVVVVFVADRFGFSDFLKFPTKYFNLFFWE